MLPFADQFDFVSANNVECKALTVNRYEFDFSGHFHADRRRGDVAEIDVAAYRSLVGGQIGSQRFDTSRFHKSNEKGRCEHRRHGGKRKLR